MSRLFSFHRGNTSQARRGPRPRFRPTLEALEGRILLNNRFVAPAGAPVDNITTFTTLQAALTTAGLATGDTIQIEPGSTPGNVVNANFTTAFTGATSLTIQGDPAVGVGAIPQFTISDATTIAAADTLNLRNVNVGLVTAGALTFNGNATVSASTVVDVNSSAMIPITLGGNTDVLTNSTLAIDTAVGNTFLDVNTLAAGSSNVISGNTFVANATTNAILAYFNGAGAAVTDKVINNAFVASAGVSVTIDLVVQESVTGLTIQNNTFSGGAAIVIYQVASTPQNLRILGNTIHATGTTLSGIDIAGGAAATTTSATISNNVVDAGANSTGLSITVNAGTVNLSIQGNDFHGDKVGVNISAGANSIAGIDLGGGSQGSLGGNNFRSFTTAATSTSGAILTDATTGTIQAQNNIFAVSIPQTVIQATAGATVNATALSANAAFVDVLYEDFLKRPGNTASAADAGGWVNQLNGGASPGSVTNAIARSAEAFGVMVDGLYVKLLSRDADAGGRQNFINFLQGGGTLEQVITLMVTAPEFANLAGSDGGFVQALYLRLLSRIGSSTEVSGWLARLPAIGRAGVAGAILNSGEFRADAVQALYGFFPQPAVSVASLLPDLLDRARAPGAGEINPWVMSSFDIDTIMVDLASSTEYFNKG